MSANDKMAMTAVNRGISASRDKYSRWHAIVGHISSEKYQKLSVAVKGVPSFPRSITNTQTGIPCMTAPCMNAKMKKSAIKGSTSNPEKLSEVYSDLSGPFAPTLGGNKYALHMMEPRTAKSDVFLVRSKDEVCQKVKEYIAYVDNHFSCEGYRVKTLRCDRAGENMPNGLKGYCAYSEIGIDPSPA